MSYLLFNIYSCDNLSLSHIYKAAHFNFISSFIDGLSVKHDFIIRTHFKIQKTFIKLNPKNKKSFITDSRFTNLQLSVQFNISAGDAKCYKDCRTQSLPQFYNSNPNTTITAQLTPMLTISTPLCTPPPHTAHWNALLTWEYLKENSKWGWHWKNFVKHFFR